MLKISLVLLLYFFASANFNIIYTGHVLLLDGTGKHKVHAIWSEGSDSSQAEFIVTDSVNHTDTILFHRLPNRNWNASILINRELSRKVGGAVIIQTNDSLKIIFGSGFSGSRYYLKKD